METAEIIANNLSLGTVEKARTYYLKIGERPEHLTPERIRRLLAEHFDAVLNFRFDDTFSRGDIEFETQKQELISKLPAMDLTTRETLINDLWGIFASGYANGYINGIQDAETFINAINEAERTDT